MPAGRPSSYSEKIAGTICERIAVGDSLRAICRDSAMPGLSTVFQWLAKHPAFAEQYARAREEQAETLASEIVAIADETPELEPVLDKDGQVVEMRLHSAYVSWQKNRVDARKWVAAKLKPKAYGDKVTNEITGPNGAALPPIVVNVLPATPRTDEAQ